TWSVSRGARGVARRVEVEFGGDRLAGVRVAQAYGLLAPQRRRRAGEVERIGTELSDEQRQRSQDAGGGDLRAGVFGASASGVEVVFAKEPERSGSPEDELLRQFQGMISEYERAQIAERTRRGTLHRARAGAVSVMSRAPYGYRYVKKTEHADAFWEIDETQA